MIPEFIDTHAHLDDERFAGDLPAVLERARRVGLSRVVTVGTTAASSLVCVELAKQNPLLVATVGLQPNHVAQAAAEDWDQICQLADQAGVVGIGETGLDRYWDYTPFSLQEEYFVRHLELARRRRLAVVIHCRQAEADVVRLLRADFERHGPLPGVMHSYSGDQATAEACLAMGLYLSFAGMVTYKNAQALRAVAARVPLERLLIETDSPYLAPLPVRGRRNEPAHLVHTAACLAETLGASVALLAQHTTRNARELFKLAGADNS